MDQTIARAVREAQELLKAGRRTEAHSILVSVVKQNPEVPEAWYLLGFAITDSDKKLYCFRQVLRINPSNDAASKQIARLTAAQPPTPAVGPFTQAGPFSTGAPPLTPLRPPMPGTVSRPATLPKPAPKDERPLWEKHPRAFWGGVVASIIGGIIMLAITAIYVSNGNKINQEVNAFYVQRNCAKVVEYNTFERSFPRFLFSSAFAAYNQIGECQAKLALDEAIKLEQWPFAYSRIQEYLISYPSGSYTAEMFERAGDVLLSWSRSLMATKDYQAAIEKLEWIQQRYSDAPIVATAVATMFEDYLIWANDLFQLRDYEGAEEILKLVVSHEKTSEEYTKQANQGLAMVHLQWGKDLVDAGEFDEGVQHYKTARGLAPTLANYDRLEDQASLTRARLLVGVGDFDGALALVKIITDSSVLEESRSDAATEQAKILDAYAHSNLEQAKNQMVQAATNMCRSEQLPAIPIFAIDPEPIRFMIVAPYSLELPDGWTAKTPAELHYVVCIEQSQTALETCNYYGSRSVRRNRYVWTVTLYEILSGKTSRSTKIQGSNPRACANTEVFSPGARTNDIYGNIPSLNDVLTWLRALNLTG